MSSNRKVQRTLIPLVVFVGIISLSVFNIPSPTIKESRTANKTKTEEIVSAALRPKFVKFVDNPQAPPMSFKEIPPLDLHVGEGTIGEALKCTQQGRINGIMHYFSTATLSCVPFPNGFPAGSPASYVPPADPTLTTILATIDNDGSGPAGSFVEDSNSPPSIIDSVVEKFAPSAHSRWLVEAWRLWEGELGNKCRENKSQKVSRGPVNLSEPLLPTLLEEKPKLPFDMGDHMSKVRKSEFITRGEHNSSLPNTLYDLHNFCIDELQGTLLGFEEHVRVRIDNQTFEGRHRMDLRSPEGLTEHIFTIRYLTLNRFMHGSNREAVDLVLPYASDSIPEEGNSWKNIMAASIDAHHKKAVGNMSQRTPLPPEVLFVEDHAIIFPTTAYNMENPGHQFHQLGSGMALAKRIKARSMLVLTDIFAQSVKDVLYHSRGYLRGNRTILDVELLPRYLITMEEEERVRANCSNEPAFGDMDKFRSFARERPASPSTTLSYDRLRDVTAQPDDREPFHPIIHEYAAAEAQFLLSRPFPFEAEFSPLLSTGEEGCERQRCGQISNEICSEEAKELRKRCGRPYAAVNIALPMVKEVDGKQYRPDTQNYSVAVWGTAVREVMREAKRLRRDVWLAANKRDRNHNHQSVEQSQVFPQSYLYMALWRSRLIDNVLSPPVNRSDVKSEILYKDYFIEYFAYRLEVNYYRETTSQPSIYAKPRRQLICYRRASIAHVFHGSISKHNPPAAIGLSTTADCNLVDTLQNVYESVWARYGMCMKGEVKEEPAKDPNRDAHPVFQLKEKRRQQLQSAFEESQSAIEKVIHDVESLPRNELLALLNATESNRHVKQLTAKIGVLQQAYDDQLMDIFTWQVDEVMARPIRVFIPMRTQQRVLTHYRNYVTALMHSGLGRYVEFHFDEGLAGGAFTRSAPYSVSDPLNTARARQYHTHLSTDIILGPHGADLHSMIYVKPSALVAELAHNWYDNANMDSFRGGFFSAFAYARHIGYLKVLIHKKIAKDDNKRDPWEKEHHTYMTLPDLRHTLSLSICSWLATNAVRLADEERDAATNATETSSYAYLLPWWCRGGSKTIVKGVIARLRAHYSFPETELSSGDENQLGRSLWLLQPRQLAAQATYYESRLSPTKYGLDVPVCPPLDAIIKWREIHHPHIKFNLAEPLPPPPPPTSAASAELAIVRTELTRQHLNRLQNECARYATDAVFGDDHLLLRRRLVEGLQSLLESILFMGEKAAYLAARVMVEGSLAAEAYESRSFFIKATLPITELSEARMCGSFPLDLDSNERDKCLSALLGALVVGAEASRSDSASSPVEVAEHFIRFLSLHQNLTTTVTNVTLRKELISYIVAQLYIPSLPSDRGSQMTLMETNEYSYSWHCSGQSADRYSAKLAHQKITETKYFDSPPIRQQPSPPAPFPQSRDIN